MNLDMLHKLQNVELNILIDIHEFCIKHDIKYSLYAGTGIGAVRHGGFIPWDDDIDIVMTRDEYNKFVEEWNKEPLSGYFMQNSTTEDNLDIDHTKIRKNNTILLSDGEDINDGHHGIWVDIFAWDKIPDDEKKRKEIYKNAYKRNIFNRGNKIHSNESFKKKCIKHILRLIPKSIRKEKELEATLAIQKYNDLTDHYSWVDLSTISCFNILFPASLTKEYTTIKFENHDFMIFKDYDTMLRLEYGDYMKFPPKDEQVCKHNPVRVEF